MPNPPPCEARAGRRRAGCVSFGASSTALVFLQPPHIHARAWRNRQLVESLGVAFKTVPGQQVCRFLTQGVHSSLELVLCLLLSCLFVFVLCLLLSCLFLFVLCLLLGCLFLFVVFVVVFSLLRLRSFCCLLYCFRGVVIFYWDSLVILQPCLPRCFHRVFILCRCLLAGLRCCRCFAGWIQNTCQKHSRIDTQTPIVCVCLGKNPLTTSFQHAQIFALHYGRPVRLCPAIAARRQAQPLKLAEVPTTRRR